MDANAEVDVGEDLHLQILRQQEHAPTQVGAALTLARDSQYGWVRETALKHLPQPAAAVPEWRAFIHISLLDAEYDVRKAAVEVVSRLSIYEEAPTLIALLRDPEELVRVEAVEALTRLTITDAAPEFERLIATDRSWLVRGYVAQGLSAVCGERATSILEQRLTVERSPWAKGQLLLALCLLGKDELLPKLLNCLQSRNYRVRCAIANRIDLVVKLSNHQLVIDALSAAVERETTVAAGEALDHALSYVRKMDLSAWRCNEG